MSEGRLRITMTLMVNEKTDKENPNEEIYLRSLLAQIRSITDLVGRGKYEMETKIDRLKTRRSSKRALKKEK